MADDDVIHANLGEASALPMMLNSDMVCLVLDMHMRICGAFRSNFGRPRMSWSKLYSHLHGLQTELKISAGNYIYTHSLIFNNLDLTDRL